MDVGSTKRRFRNCGSVSVTDSGGGGGGCTSNSDCGSGEVCENGQCVQDDSGGGGAAGLSMAMILIIAVAILGVYAYSRG